MWRIRRIKLDGIGTRAARFRDLELDLTSERTGEPLHSLVWLRNGGGKSSLIALVAALLRPAKHEFLSAAGSGRTVGRALGDYILDGDTAHVVIEWGDESGRRLVTGGVFEWLERTAPPDPARDQDRLRQIRYMFVPLAGVAELDRLPFATAGKRTDADAFLTTLSAWASQTTVEITRTQAEWLRRLDAYGIDSDLWRAIVEMNRTEGGIDAAFVFRNPNDFVRYLLGITVDPADLDPVAALLAEVAEQLATRPAAESDIAFATGAIDHLRALAVAHRDDVAAAELVTESEAAARRFRCALQAAMAVAEADRQTAEQEYTEASAARVENNSAYDAARLTAAEYRRLAAVLRVDAAKEGATDSTARAGTARGIADAWVAAEPVVAADTAKEHLRSVQAAFDERMTKAQPLEQRRIRSGGELAASLESLAVQAIEIASTSKAAQSDWNAKAATAAGELGTATADVATKQERAKALARILARFDGTVDALRAEGALTPGEQLADALERLRAADAAQRGRTETITAERRGIEAETLAERAALRAANTALGPERGALDRLTAERSALLETISSLAGDARLEALAEGEFDPVGRADALRDRLRAAVAAAETGIVTLAVEDREDDRALAAIAEGGLLPASIDLERALDTLDSARISAVAGWTYLGDAVAANRRLAAFLAAPLLAGGVLVNDPTDLPRARKVLAGGLGPTSVIGLGTTRDLAAAISALPQPVPGILEQSADIVLPNAAMYDRTRAEDERPRRDTAREARAFRSRDLATARDGDRALADRLTALVAACPPGWLDALATQIKVKEAAVEGFAVDAADAERRLDVLAERVSGLATESEQIAQKRQQIGRFEARLAPLVGQAAEIAQERAEAAELPTAIEFALARIDAARSAESDARARATEARDRARDAAEQVRGFRTEREALPPDIVPIRASTGVSLEALRTAYHSAVAAHHDATVGSPVGLALDIAKRAHNEAATRAAAIEPAIVSAARALLAGPDGVSPQTRATATRAAATARDDTIAAQTRAESELSAAREELRGLEASLPTGQRVVEPPANREDALLRAARADAEQQARRTATAAAAERADAAEKRVSAQRTRIELLGDRAAGLSEVAAGDDPADIQAFAGSTDEARAELTRILEEFHGAHAERRRTQAALQRLAFDVASWAGGPSFFSVAAEVRDRFITPTVFVESGPEADSLVHDYEIRRHELTRQLAALDEHRDNVVTRALGLVRNALHDLERFSKVSEVPEGLPGWTGHRFVDVAARTSVRLDDPAVRVRIAEAIDGIIASRNVLDGHGLLWAALSAVVGEVGFRAKILKPTASLSPERDSIEQMGKWSGGEKVTAAILLFSAIAKLRAANRGRSLAGGGALILDNPVGKANYVGFLDLQLRIAEAAGVQLVFFTGLSDLRAIDRFPNVLRLRNILASGREYVRIDDRAQDEDAITAARGQRLAPPEPLFAEP
jgi:hypothetical protein